MRQVTLPGPNSPSSLGGDSSMAPAGRGVVAIDAPSFARCPVVSFMRHGSSAAGRRIQVNMTYEPTAESVSRHLLPQWYDDAKFGIFIHWSVFSVPAWAPTTHSIIDVGEGKTPMWNMPYVEFYSNWMKVAGSPT